MRQYLDYSYNSVGSCLVTLQVALIAADGFILASDQKSSRPDGSSTYVTKLCLSDRKNVAIAASGTSSAGKFADRLVKTLDTRTRDLRSQTRQTINDEAQKIFDYFVHGDFSEGYGRVLVDCTKGNRLILTIPGVPQLWEVRFNPDGPDVNQIEDSKCILMGDENNPARYFLSYFDPAKSVADLLPLAALTISEGAKFNPDIGRLDILVHEDRGAVRFLSNKELDDLATRCSRIRDNLTRALFG